ncbi:MAG: hypothetical protein M3020_12630, partial [Myxococcota bacterium]|nr:hypothetical protein [Myxococcota bacterium]
MANPPDADDAGSRLRALGWHQGALIPIARGTGLPEILVEAFEHAIVASQDCDIVANVKTEAAVDLLPAVVSSESSADQLYGKNPRKLCLALGNGQFATVDVRRRVTVEKSLVSAIEPVTSASLSVSERKVLAKWLGKRYTRPAFPDAFNERLRPNTSKLDRLLKRAEGRQVTAILLQLNTEVELEQAQTYSAIVWFACRPAVAEDSEIRLQLEEYAAAFAQVLEACEGVHVE